jgi:archaeal type IV pilus assembly protein PilA
MRRRVPDESAVSPVIGVILLVAITVVLSATVFVMVMAFKDDSARPAPTLTMSKDQAESEAQVVRAGGGLDWFEDMRVSGSCTPLLNGAAFPTAPGRPVRGGDVLTCAPGEDLQISSSPALGNTLLYQATFD